MNLFAMNLITIEPNLVFDQSNNNGETFQNFVEGLLNQPAASHRIRRFSLKLQNLNKSQFKLVNDCLRNVLKRGIIDLELDIKVKQEDGYLLPFEIFTCETVENLKLGSGFVISMIPSNALLPALKILALDSVRFDDLEGCAFQRFLSACRVIEELVVDGFNWEHWKWSRIVSSLTLKRLTMRRNEWHEYDRSESDTMSFDTPNVTYFEYSDILLYEYPIVNLNSLVEAKLRLFRIDDGDDCNHMNLIKGLKNVEILQLDFRNELEMVFDGFSEEDTVFENLLHLTFISEPDFCWVGQEILFEKSPKLNTLTLKGTLHYNSQDVESVCDCLSEYSFLSSCPIEVLKITDFSSVEIRERWCK